ncbi:MAG: hypothetical protein ACRCZI_05395 [Cetobacterium sp.]
MKRSEEEINQAMTMLHKVLKPGSTVFCVLHHVSPSGMRRRISFYTIYEGGMINLTGYMEVIGLGKRFGYSRGIVVRGCGMDMGVDMVHQLGSVMWPASTGECALMSAWL